MRKKAKNRWEKMRTEESRLVEEVLRKEFPQADAYRYNSASIRVRVVDPRFAGKSVGKRVAMVERLLKELPDAIEGDIMNLLTLAPDETANSIAAAAGNEEFEEPSPSEL